LRKPTNTHTQGMEAVGKHRSGWLRFFLCGLRSCEDFSAPGSRWDFPWAAVAWGAAGAAL